MLKDHKRHELITEMKNDHKESQNNKETKKQLHRDAQQPIS